MSPPGAGTGCSHVLLLWGLSKTDSQSVRRRRWRALGSCVQPRALDRACAGYPVGTTGYGSSMPTALAWQTLQQSGWAQVTSEPLEASEGIVE
ncbi:unnamed protein product [Gulo gulo]|uniref:Uncharacterized protein n=1 Tax=Gulo gulo TaxID=48420 RepID=A0A9X9M8S2_GULGU|nr:unnamed protein product [Gulo gulo]